MSIMENLISEMSIDELIKQDNDWKKQLEQVNTQKNEYINNRLLHSQPIEADIVGTYNETLTNIIFNRYQILTHLTDKLIQERN